MISARRCPLLAFRSITTCGVAIEGAGKERHGVELLTVGAVAVLRHGIRPAATRLKTALSSVMPGEGVEPLEKRRRPPVPERGCEVLAE
jgi:hypothetical protein